MIVRQFISWVRTAPAGERAEATRSLARAWLISNLSEDDRAAAEGALLMLLDDASPLVRRAMADVFARSADAPAAIVQALALDQPSVALPILEHSPLLIDADLVDLIATGNCETQCAIARRAALPRRSAPLSPRSARPPPPRTDRKSSRGAGAFSWDRIVERHGHLAAIRESMLALDDLPPATRLALAAKLSETLTQFVVARGWLSSDRAERIAGEARERSAVNLATRSRGDDLRNLVRHLRASGQLTPGLILRALLSGNLDQFDSALMELSGLPASPCRGDDVGPSRRRQPVALLSRPGCAVNFPAFAPRWWRPARSLSGSMDGAARAARAWSSACGALRAAPGCVRAMLICARFATIGARGGAAVLRPAGRGRDRIAPDDRRARRK